MYVRTNVEEEEMNKGRKHLPWANLKWHHQEGELSSRSVFESHHMQQCFAANETS